jgi:hypothetical protein
VSDSITCESCGGSFSWLGGRGGHLRATCYTCSDEDRRRNIKLKNRYDITLLQYRRIYESQKGACAICDRPVTFEGNKTMESDPALDHCHTTGKVRGILCYHCNTALGHVFDDQRILARMGEYLR